MATNDQILNLVRTTTSEEYNTRIPTATKTNWQKIGEIITEYPNVRNEFISTLTNKVGKTIYETKIYKNPFSFMDRGMLPYGKSIEDIHVDIISAKDYKNNPTAEETLGSVDMSEIVKTAYFTENYRHQYEIQLSDQQLKGAFYDANGLQTLLGQILMSPINSKNMDRYLLCKQALCNTEIKSVNIKTTASESEKAKELSKVIRTYIEKFKFLSNEYNAGGVHTFTLPEELIIYVTPETKALVDVELLASQFNMDKADFISKVVTIDSFTQLNPTSKIAEADTKTLAIVADKLLVQNYKTLDSSESMRNPKGIYTKTFYNDWGVVFSCPFVNAIKIKQA